MVEKIKYVNVSIPNKLAEAVDKYIKEHSELDLRSRAQVVNFALRFLFVESNRNKVKIKKE